MRQTDETTRIRRAFAYGRSVEWLGDPRVSRVLAEGTARTVRELRAGLRLYSRQSLVAGRIPAFVPRGPARGAEAPGCCAPACCA